MLALPDAKNPVPALKRLQEPLDARAVAHDAESRMEHGAVGIALTLVCLSTEPAALAWGFVTSGLAVPVELSQKLIVQYLGDARRVAAAAAQRHADQIEEVFDDVILRLVEEGRVHQTLDAWTILFMQSEIRPLHLPGAPTFAEETVVAAVPDIVQSLAVFFI